MKSRIDAPIVIAAGGTGGHIFPAEAFAEACLARGETPVLMTDKRFARFQQGVFTKVDVYTIRAGTVHRGLKAKLLGPVNMVIGIGQAYAHLRTTLRPKVVVGFGGYPSFPSVFAASRLGIPTLIHEQNSVLGRANRLLAPRVSRIALSFPATSMIAPADMAKTVLTGNPVRSEIRALADMAYPELSLDGKLQILITGGSQGATVFSEIMPGALKLLPLPLRARIRLDQQCRAADIEAVRAAYAEIGVNADLATFFPDMANRLARAHLVIARSGASTVSELAVAGRPAILVPYPYAMDNHQYSNANAFEDAGGGWVIAQDGFTPEALAARLEAFLSRPATLAKAAESARGFGKINAASTLLDSALALA